MLKICEKKILFWEPCFFIIFGIFHLHRIWALVDRIGYADFWLDKLNNRGPFYFTLMGALSLLCILGIVTFFKNICCNYWWRWIYLFGGSYLIFDLCAILFKFSFWYDLLDSMFDVNSSYWNIIWLFFILLGAFSFALGIILLRQRKNR